jgi:hypothetical protein
VNDIEEKKQHPDQVDPVDLIFSGMLDEARHSAKKVPKCKGKDHAQQNFDVNENVHRGIS